MPLATAAKPKTTVSKAFDEKVGSSFSGGKDLVASGALKAAWADYNLC